MMAPMVQRKIWTRTQTILFWPVAAHTASGRTAASMMPQIGKMKLKRMKAMNTSSMGPRAKVGSVAVGGRVEVDLLAAEPAGLGLDPGQQAVGMALAAVGLQRDEVVDVDQITPGEGVEAAE